MNQLITITPDKQRAQLLAQKQQLSEQLKTLQFQLFDQNSPDVVEHINELQLEKARQQGILQLAQQQLAQLNTELDNFNTGAEQLLLEAIVQQDWYGFKNKREIVFDKRTGLLFPNFEYVPHIAYNDWKNAQKDYAPSEIRKGQWINLDSINYKNSNFKIDVFGFPLKYSGNHPISIIYHDDKDSSPFRHFVNFHKNGNYNKTYSQNITNQKVFPTLKVIDNPELVPDYPRLTPHEKAKIILDFFIEQDWIPNFEPYLEKNSGDDDDDFNERLNKAQQQSDEQNRIFAAYYQRFQLQRNLVDLERQLVELPEPEPENLFTSDFDYRQALKSYNLTEINQSVWQYSLSVQHWISHLLSQIDDWDNRHQHLMQHALELNASLAKKSPTSISLNDTEQQLFNTQHQCLKQKLNFGLTPLRSTLIELLHEAQQFEQQLKSTSSLQLLATIEQQARPSFSLLAEHTATLCTQTLKRLEWLENSLPFVQAIVQSKQQGIENYLILLDKYQQDITQIGQEASMETEVIAQWFNEWRQQRLQIVQQWQPLVEAGLYGMIDEQSALDTLHCLSHYQQRLDRFYLEKRLGIHTTYAFVSNGHRQEKLETEQELTKQIHELMQQLEQVIFASPNTAQKIWLIRFSEVWQQGIVQQITEFLAHEDLLERSDITQIINEEMRKVQQQNLASCLQDAKTYSAALAQREKDISTLIFKMRKALQK